MAFTKFGQSSGGSQRQMFDVSAMNIKCRDCQTPITELPFNPDPARVDSLRCRDCLKKWREENPRPRRRF